jgi:signal transduction histidine kinase
MIKRLGTGLRTTFVGADPAAPLTPKPWLVSVGLIVLIGIGGIQITDLLNQDMSLLFAAPIGILSVLPVAFLWHKPLWAWRLMALGLVLAGFAAYGDQPWPWNATQIVVGLIVLFVVGLRESLEVLVWIALTMVWFDVTMVRGGNAVVIAVLIFTALVLGEQIGRRRRIQRALVVETERTEVAEAREAVLRERTRIARELHDVVAHSMSLVAVRAETAPYRLPDLPAPAREEFLALAGTARDTLTELRRLLGVLRTDRAELAPQPGLSDVDDLVAAARDAGLDVETDVLGVPNSDAIGLTVYRIVQEALSNASQHSPGAAVRVAVSASGGDVRVEVTNTAPDGPASPRTGEGHGLVGMRERVELLGGTLQTGPTPDGGFTVVAWIPEAP